MNNPILQISGGFSSVQIEGDIVRKKIAEPTLLRREHLILIALIGRRGFPQLDQEQSQSCLVMNKVPGNTIGQIVQDEIIKPAKGIKIIFALSAVLASLHDQHKIIHNDICPHNSFYCAEKEEGHLIDFGVSISAGSNDLNNFRNYGKPEFKSPEKIDANLPFGLSSDIFSLGAVFYLISEGIKPFSAELGNTDKQILGYTPDKPESISKRVGNLIMGMIEKNPLNRPSAIEVEKEIKDCLGE